MTHNKTIIAFFLLVACETGPAPKPVSIKWETMTAEKCVALCSPLAVRVFVPQCARENKGSYYRCPGGEAVEIQDICACGQQTPTKQAVTQTVDTTTPVILHHGLKAVLGH